MTSIARTVVDRSLKLARAPLDMALGVAGASRSPAKLAVDRVEAGVRRTAGVVLGDRGLKRDADRREVAAEERERALQLQEEAEHRRVEAEKQRRSRERRVDKAAQKAKADGAQRARAAKLESLKARRKRRSTPRRTRPPGNVRPAGSKARPPKRRRRGRAPRVRAHPVAVRSHWRFRKGTASSATRCGASTGG